MASHALRNFDIEWLILHKLHFIIARRYFLYGSTIFFCYKSPESSGNNDYVEEVLLFDRHGHVSGQGLGMLLLLLLLIIIIIIIIILIII